MNRFKKILYISRGTHTQTEGLKQALGLARNNGVELSVLVILPELPKEIKGHEAAHRKAVTDDMDAVIRQAANHLSLPETGVPFAISVDYSNTPVTRVIQHVLKTGYDLAIKESDSNKGERGFKAFDMDLLRKCPCPVWLSRPISTPSKDIKVAVAIDPEIEDNAGTNLSIRMLELGLSLAAEHDGKLTVLSCWDYEFEQFMRHNPWAGMPDEKVSGLVEDTRQTHLNALETLIARASEQRYGAFQIKHMRGKPENLIPQSVDENNIDILIMGTVARAGIPGFIIGNTAENIVRNLSASLLALKPEGFISPVRG